MKYSDFLKLHHNDIEKGFNLVRKHYPEIFFGSDETGNVLAHHGVKGQKWGVRNGPPYPIDKSKKSDKIEGQRAPKISEDKFINYALDYDRAPDKARVFKSALGYTKENCKELIKDIEKSFDVGLLEERGDQGHGMRYQQIMRLTGPNGKSANVLTAWIEDGDDIRLTSVYVTKKEVTKND